MKQLGTALLSHVRDGTTSLSYCWKVVRTDGKVLGFTDHDQDIQFEGVTYEAVTGFTGTDLVQSLGLAIDGLQASGALSSDSITEFDLMQGLFNDAEITLTLVNWASVDQSMVLLTGNIGQVTRVGNMFTAELRSLVHRLNQIVGYTFARSCSALLGDSRCKKDISGPTFRGNGTLTTGGLTRIFSVSGLGSFADDWFTTGQVGWLGGANEGQTFEIKRHTKTSGIDVIELWDLPGAPTAVGDVGLFIVGCKKDPNTCVSKFDNIVNYRGFNLVPPKDIITNYPTSSQILTGGSLFATLT